eukprot:SAG11_NODE_10821_length_803_cov_1.617898_1_plen_143_part_00
MLACCTRYGYGRIRVRRVRVLLVRAHRRSSRLKLRVSTGGLNVSRGTRSTSTEASVLYGSSVSYVRVEHLAPNIKTPGAHAPNNIYKIVSVPDIPQLLLFLRKQTNYPSTRNGRRSTGTVEKHLATRSTTQDMKTLTNSNKP